jgi:hypothetical protein
MLDNAQSARMASDPEVIARAIAEALTARRPKTRCAAGAGARPLLLLRSLLSDRLFDRLMWTASQGTRPNTVAAPA